MSNDDMIAKLDQAMILINEVRVELTEIPPPVPTGVRTVEEFDEAYASGEAEIACDYSLVYDKALTLNRQIRVYCQMSHDNRVTIDDENELAKFTKGITIAASNCTISGLHVTDDALDDIIVCKTGISNTVIVQCLIEGNANKRGIYCNTSGIVDRCWIDGIMKVGQDTQAIIVTAMQEPGLVITDCFLAAAGMSFMAGGDDHTEALKPRNITIQNSELVKTQNMYSASPLWQRKNALELKNVRGFKMVNCHLSGAGIAQGQGGYLMIFSPRNQYGRDPSSCVENVEITNCIGDTASGIASFLGKDTNFPSGPLNNLRINNFKATNLDPKGVTGGHARVFMWMQAPQNVEIANVDIQGINLKSISYFDGAVPPVAAKLISWRYPNGTPYTWHSTKGDTLPSLKLYAPDIVLEDLVPRL